MAFKRDLKYILLEITIVLLTPEVSSVIAIYDNNSLRYCYLCNCTDCQLPQDSWCISPISNYLARGQYIQLGRTDYFNMLRKRRYTGGQKQAQLETDGWCSFLTWDERFGNHWGKTIERTFGDVLYKEKVDLCREHMNDTINYKNVVCEICSFHMCNFHETVPFQDCYSCECNDCRYLQNEDCMIPSQKNTRRIAMELERPELNEYCSIESWMENNKHLYIRRGIKHNLDDFMEDSRYSRKRKHFIHNLCNTTLCNDIAIVPKIKPICYECTCEMCDQKKHRYCLMPNPKTTNVTKPIADDEFCVTISAIHEKSRTLYVERRGTCVQSFCSRRIEKLSKVGYTKFQCSSCRRQLCNSNKKFNILKVLNPGETVEEKAGVEL